MDILTLKKDAYKNDWYKLVKNNGLANGNLPPEIVNSWRRSLKLDPYNISNNTISDDDYLRIREENQDLIEIAKPIMKDICDIAGPSFVLLCDHNGRTIDHLSNIDYPIPARGIYSENNVGTNAIGTALIEKKPLEIRYKEHYSIRFQQYSCAGVPVLVNNEIVGVVCVVNPYDDLPKGFSRTVKLGVKVIEKQLQMKKEDRLIKQETALFKLFNSIDDCILILDSAGRIIFTNNVFLKRLGERDKDSLVGLSIKDLIDDSHSINQIMLEGISNNRTNLVFIWKNRRVKGVLLKKWDFKREENRVYVFFHIFDESSKDYNSNNALFNLDDALGHSKEWLKIKEKSVKASKVNSNILIEGESGTGKELIAQAIHSESGRRGAFVPINCGGISKGLLESELFGYEEGAFTGALKKGKVGKIESADGGTLFLDEIGEMPLDMQVSLLRFLQNGLIIRVGSNEQKKVDVRIIAATNRKLSKEVSQGSFREDLFFRLNVINLVLPPLRDRREDVEILANSICENLCIKFNRGRVMLADETIKILTEYDWPGNVRELKNVIESSIVFLEGDTIYPKDLPNYFQINPTSPKLDDINTLGAAERTVVLKALEESNGNVTWAADKLGFARNTMYRKMKKLKIVKGIDYI